MRSTMFPVVITMLEGAATGKNFYVAIPHELPINVGFKVVMTDVEPVELYNTRAERLEPRFPPID